ncbi:MAG: helix-turn-helix domain-containing protein [Desulfuromonadales bacterium]
MDRVIPHVRQLPATPDLAPYVHRFMHGVSESPGELRIPPTGGIFLSYVVGSPLIVHFNERVYDRSLRLFLGGQLCKERPVLRSEGRFELIGAELTPTGYYKLFHRPANHLTDSIADLSEIHPDAATQLECHLKGACELSDIIASLEQGLSHLACTAITAPVVEAIIEEIHCRNGVVRVADLCRKQGISTRRIRRYFEHAVGVSPKHFAKICQLNSVIRAMKEADGERLRSLALDHGFYDQAHFIHDFQSLVAMDPSGFLRDSSPFLRTYLGNASRLRSRADSL